MLGLRLAHPAPLGLRRGVVQVARARPTRLQCARRAIPLCTATPGGGKGDAQSRRRNATPRVEPVPADPLTEAAAKQTSRLKKELAEVRPPAPSPAPEAQPNPEWEAWEQYFASCDRAGYLISALEAQQDAAVQQERFEEAAAVRSAIAAIEDKDSVTGLLRALDDAIKSERFSEAAKLRDLGAGLVGWWAGKHEPRDGEEADPYGCILRVSPALGRFVGSIYAVRDLVGMQGGAPDPHSGFPVLELFVQKDASTGKERYKLQPVAVYGGAPPMDLTDTVSEALTAAAMSGAEVNVEIVMQGIAAAAGAAAEVEFDTVVEEEDDEFDEEFSEGVLDLGDTIAELLLNKPFSDEPLFQTIDLGIDFLADEMAAAVSEEDDMLRVPATLTRLGRDAFVFEHVPPETDDDEEEDEDDAVGVEELVEGSACFEDEGVEDEGPEDDSGGKAYTIRDAIADARREGRPGPGLDWPGAGPRPAGAQGWDGAPEASGRGAGAAGAQQGSGSTMAGDDRGLDIEVGAGFFDKWDSVAAEIDKLDAASDPKARQALIKAVREAAESIIASHGLPSDTKVVISTDGPPGSPSSPQQGPQRPEHTLLQRMRFDRIRPAPPTDPFSQLYVGNFGPHGPEAIAMVRGAWGEERGFPDDHVTAFKVTGDENVPVGRATFRARVGRQHKLNPAEVYPEELGVLARYRGEGRVARAGFQAASWAEGELLILDGQASITGGAEMGFVWSIPGERRFLILFSKLRLPEEEEGGAQ